MGGATIENANHKPPQVLRTLLEAFLFWGSDYSNLWLCENIPSVLCRQNASQGFLYGNP